MPGAGLNKNNSAVKRIMQEARELANDPCTDYHAAPLEDDIFEWHCTLRGSEGTEFEGGLYHFRILLPAEYPFRPPSIMMLTPNGRFELNTKICISFTNYHEELWQPAWGVRTAIIGLQGFFPLKGQAAVGVGSIESPSSERKRLAALSKDWVCPHCKVPNRELLPDPAPSSTPITGKDESRSGAESVLKAVPESTETSELHPSPAEKDASHSQRPFDLGAEQQDSSKNVRKDQRSVVSDTDKSTPTVMENTSGGAGAIFIATPPLPNSPAAGYSPSVRRSSHKPPLLLDIAIMALLVLVFVIICRRMV